MIYVYCIFEKNVYNTKCVFTYILRILSEICFILSRTQRGLTKICNGDHAQYPLFLSDFNKI